MQSRVHAFSPQYSASKEWYQRLKVNRTKRPCAAGVAAAALCCAGWWFEARFEASADLNFFSHSQSTDTGSGGTRIRFTTAGESDLLRYASAAASVAAQRACTVWPCWRKYSAIADGRFAPTSRD